MERHTHTSNGTEHPKQLRRCMSEHFSIHHLHMRTRNQRPWPLGRQGKGGCSGGEPPPSLSEGIDETVEFRRVIPVRGSKRYAWGSQDVDDQHQPFSRRLVERLVQLAVVEHDDLAFGVESHLNTHKGDAKVNVYSGPGPFSANTMQCRAIEPAE